MAPGFGEGFYAMKITTAKLAIFGLYLVARFLRDICEYMGNPVSKMRSVYLTFGSYEDTECTT